MRIATWNVNSLKVRIDKVTEWLGYAKPDVLCMQETKLANAAFPAMDFERLGYEYAHHGEGRWNGVAILSKEPITDVVNGFGDDADDNEARVITARCGDVRVTSVYVPNGRTLDSEHYENKLRWLDRLGEFIARTCDPKDKAVVCGDFNVAPTDDDLWNPEAFVGSTHVSDEERKRVKALESWGMVDSFGSYWNGRPKLFSWWDYRQGNFHKGRGMRIDLLMMTKPLADNIDFALMDRNARKGAGPSDHAPVFVDVNQ